MDEYVLNFSYRIFKINIHYTISNIQYFILYLSLLSFVILLAIKYKIQFLYKIKLKNITCNLRTNIKFVYYL